MTQGDFICANANGQTYRADVNTQLMALGTLSSGSSEPATKYAHQLWADTTNNLLKVRNSANNAWITVGDLTAANLGLSTVASPTFTGTVTTPDLSVSGTSRLKLAVGTTAQRPTGATGDVRFNSTLSRYEGYNGSSWTEFGEGVPVGSVFYRASATVPSGYLECNGAAVSRTTYAALYTVLGVVFGAGDGSSTFGLPDLRGEFIRGADNSRGIDSGRALGSSQADELKAHTHNITQDLADSAGENTRQSPSTTASGTASWISSTGGTETRPRNVALMPIIKF